MMKRRWALLISVIGLFVWLAVTPQPQLFAQAPASFRGVVTDPSGAVVPDALVQLRGPGGEQRTKTDAMGKYSFASLRPGKYLVRVIAKGFTVTEKRDFDISGPVLLDVQLTIETQSLVVNVEDEAAKVTIDPASSGGAIVLGSKEIEALSDDPDELQQQLKALAGPGVGPSGGQIYIDGFSGANLPSKSTIREIRINANPLTPEFDRPGFGRIEIFTRPGSDKLRGQVFAQWNKEALNSRSPLLARSQRPQYQNKMAGFNLGGPIKKQKASFGLDVNRQQMDENAFIYATRLDANLNPQDVNQAVLTPQTRSTIIPRLDYTLTPSHTLILRYQDNRSSDEKAGLGGFNLPSQTHANTMSSQTIQMTETAMVNAHSVNETRFQYMRTHVANNGDNSAPAISVQGAFTDGGAQIGHSGNLAHRWELTNTTTYTRQKHTLKWGGRIRQSSLDDTSMNNFGGTFTFMGGAGPVLDANNQPVAGSLALLSALERYRRTLLFQRMGLTSANIRLYGGGATQFTLSAGTPTLSVKQFDVGLFVNDDFRLRPNIMLSYGIRYEAQTNLGDLANWGPRLGLAWGVGGTASKPAKTVVRAGVGAFFDRLSENLVLQSRRFDGLTQQSFFILGPDFFPAVPTVASLTGGKQPQTLYLIDPSVIAPRTYLVSAGVDRQVNSKFRLSGQYIGGRILHVTRSLNINAPINGVYPFGDKQFRMSTQTTGQMNINQFVVSPVMNYKRVMLAGFYSLAFVRSNAEGQPADPYNLKAEWGPSAADVRHRMAIMSNLNLPKSFSVAPILTIFTGSPYNITSGRDSNLDGFAAERPALVPGLAAAQCQGGDLKYAAAFGCFNLSPAAGTPVIGRNFGRGPANYNVMLRVSRTWSFGKKEESGQAAALARVASAMGGVAGSAAGAQMAMMGGAGATPRKYNLTLTLNATNLLNHSNYGAPSGDLSSPFFGQYRSLAAGIAQLGGGAGSSTYNRKIDVQLRFMF